MTTDAADELTRSGVSFELVQFGSAASLEEAAWRQGMEPGRLVKTMVVRLSGDDFRFVLVPGRRVIDWPRLRRHLGKSRLSLATAAEVEEATGYRPGAITPLGSSRAWPVVADERIRTPSEVSIGSGKAGTSIHLKGADLLEHLHAETANITTPEQPPG